MAWQRAASPPVVVVVVVVVRVRGETPKDDALNNYSYYNLYNHTECIIQLFSSGSNVTATWYDNPYNDGPITGTV